MFNPFKKGNKTTISAINIKLQGHTHRLEGFESDKDNIEVKLPFKNKTHTDILTKAKLFKTETGKPLNISGLKVTEPFKLISVEPKMPIVIKPDETINFKIVVSAPSHNYTGPLNLNFESVSEEVIHLELAKTVLIYKGKKTEIEVSSRMLNLQKNGIFVENVQMLKAISFGDTVSKAEAAFPFKLVNTEPRMPVKLDKPNGYIISFYIQAPEHNYSGVLELSIS